MDVASEKTELKTGNAMQLKNIPSGQFVHNIEMIPGKGAQMATKREPPARIIRCGLPH